MESSNTTNNDGNNDDNINNDDDHHHDNSPVNLLLNTIITAFAVQVSSLLEGLV